MGSDEIGGRFSIMREEPGGRCSRTIVQRLPTHGAGVGGRATGRFGTKVGDIAGWWIRLRQTWVGDEAFWHPGGRASH